MKMKKRAPRGETAIVPARPTTDQASPAGRSTRLLASLGLHGLAHLDAPVLAALASETPMLLIGPQAAPRARCTMTERLTAGGPRMHQRSSAPCFALRLR